MERRVEPPEERFPFGIGVVIDLHDGGCRLFGVHEEIEPFGCAVPGSGGDGVHGFSWEPAFESGFCGGDGFRGEGVALVENDEVCLFELFEEDVGDFW